jgi:uncharacterized protein
LPRPLRYWTLLGQKAGDNRQLEALGTAATARFGWEGSAKPLAFNRWDLWLQLTRQASLTAVPPPFRAALTPPWPDLVLTAGRRNEPVARWLRRASGGHCKIVHLGRPWTHPRQLDLTLTTAQYALDPTLGPVVCLPTPLGGPASLGASRLRRHHGLLLLGGPSGTQALSPAFAVALVRRFLALCTREGLRPRVSTSPRTPKAVETAVAEALRGTAGRGAERFLWHQALGAPNPLGRWLTEGELAVVTGDSMSMILEAMSAGCVTAYAPLPAPWTLRWESVTHRLAQRFAPRRFRRNTQDMLRSWEAAGGLWPLAALEDGPLPTPSPAAATLPETSLEMALGALARLMEDEP